MFYVERLIAPSWAPCTPAGRHRAGRRSLARGSGGSDCCHSRLLGPVVGQVDRPGVTGTEAIVSRAEAVDRRVSAAFACSMWNSRVRAVTRQRGARQVRHHGDDGQRLRWLLTHLVGTHGAPGGGRVRVRVRPVTCQSCRVRDIRVVGLSRMFHVELLVAARARADRIRRLALSGPLPC